MANENKNYGSTQNHNNYEQNRNNPDDHGSDYRQSSSSRSDANQRGQGSRPYAVYGDGYYTSSDNERKRGGQERNVDYGGTYLPSSNRTRDYSTHSDIDQRYGSSRYSSGSHYDDQQPQRYRGQSRYEDEHFDYNYTKPGTNEPDLSAAARAMRSSNERERRAGAHDLGHIGGRHGLGVTRNQERGYDHDYGYEQNRDYGHHYNRPGARAYDERGYPQGASFRYSEERGGNNDDYNNPYSKYGHDLRTSPDPQVRHEAAQRLGKLGGKQRNRHEDHETDYEREYRHRDQDQNH